MEELHKFDEVAYVRYASVYRHFQDVEAFREEVDRLRHRRGKLPSEDQLSLLPGECSEETRQGAQMKFSAFDEAAMRRALELANAACTAPIRIRAWARCWRATRKSSAKAGTNAPVRPHAEPIAIRAAGDRARGATAYVTLEPCSHHGRTPPCVDVLLAAGVRRVVYAVGDPNPRVNGAGAARLKEAGLKVQSGLLVAEAEALNAGFLMRMRHRRPFIRLKTGASLDGTTALANGESKWITSEEARADVQHWRAQSGAVLTSAATVLADDPRLDVRIEARASRCAWCSIGVARCARRRVSSPRPATCWCSLRRPGTQGGPERGATGRCARRAHSCHARSHLDLRRVFARLAELEVNDVLVEAGPRLAGALFAAGLVDEWLLYIAPKFWARMRNLWPHSRDSRGSTPRPNSSCSIRRWSARTCGCGCSRAQEEDNVHRHRAGNRRTSGASKPRGAPGARKIGASKWDSATSRASGSTWATASAWTACASRWPGSARQFSGRRFR